MLQRMTRITNPLKYFNLLNRPNHAVERRAMATCTQCGSATSCCSSSFKLPPSPFSQSNTTSPSWLSTLDIPPYLPLSNRNPQVVEEEILRTTFYRRPLPCHLNSFMSSQGKKLFRQSLEQGFAESYFSLAGAFTTQSEPAFCGLGSLAMVLNALQVDPKRRWKGGWRWYSDEMLECCAPLDLVRKKGITFNEFECIARCNELNVVAKYGHHASLDEFRNDLKRSCSSEFPHETHVVVSFCRKTLGQTGDGHFSPVACYNPDTDKILVLDTARFKYPSYFVSVEMLYEAMQGKDPETDLPRGYFLLRRSTPKVSL